MGKCINAKFNGSLGDNSKLKLNEFTVEFVGDSSVLSLGIFGNGNYGVRIVSGTGYFTNSAGTEDYGQTYTITDNYIRVKTTSGCVVAVEGRYSAKGGFVGSNNQKIIVGSEVIRYNNGGIGEVSKINIAGKFSDLSKITKRLEVRVSNMDASNAYATLETILSSANLQTVSVIGLDNNDANLSQIDGHSISFTRFDGISGDIKYLANTSTTSFFISASQQSRITGSIEEFVQYSISHGKTSGTFTLNWARNYTGITYQGIPLSQNMNVPNINLSSFTWDSEGNISWNS